MAAFNASLINGLHPKWANAYGAAVNRRRRLRNRLASLRNSKRRRVRKKWLKFEPPATPDASDYVYIESAPTIEVWTR